MSKLIIDVSYHNGVINWEKVKASGCAELSLDVDMEIISHRRTISSGFVTLLSVKGLAFRLESICTAMRLATDRHRVNLITS